MNKHDICASCFGKDGQHWPACPVAAALQRREVLWPTESLLELEMKALIAVVFNGGYSTWQDLSTLVTPDSQRLTLVLGNLVRADWLEESTVSHLGQGWSLTPFASRLLEPVLSQAREQQERRAA